MSSQLALIQDFSFLVLQFELVDEADQDSDYGSDFGSDEEDEEKIFDCISRY